MTTMEKIYNLPPPILWNGVGDVVEMHKAKIINSNINQSEPGIMVFETDMYSFKTRYTVQVIPGINETTLVAIGTIGKEDDDKRNIALMFKALDTMLAPFMTAGETNKEAILC